MKCLMGSTKIDVFIQNNGLLAVYKGKLAVTLFSCLPAVHTVYRPFFGENTPIFLHCILPSRPSQYSGIKAVSNSSENESRSDMIGHYFEHLFVPRHYADF